MKIQTKKQMIVALLLAVGGASVQSSTVASGTIDHEQDVGGANSYIIEGLIEPWEDLLIGVGVEGLIDEVFVQRGQRVKAGEKIVRLESSVEEAQVALSRATSKMKAGLESAQARERLARLRADSHRTLYERGAVTKEELDQAQTEEELAILKVREVQETIVRARLDLRVAEAMLSRRTVVSPVDGVIVERFLSPGELVNRVGSVHVVRIAQIHPLKIDVIAPLALFRQIKEGQKALVSPVAPIGGIHEATVTVVDPLVDAASGTFRIRLELPNETMEVPAGIRCRVQFQN